ncbi:hypothetical protein BG51_02000 [Pseudomonas [fluorescens] ATCC 17400]
MQERQKLSAINLTVDFWCFSQPVKVKQGNCRLTGHSGAVSRALFRLFSKYFKVAKYLVIGGFSRFSTDFAENKSA